MDYEITTDDLEMMEFGEVFYSLESDEGRPMLPDEWGQEWLIVRHHPDDRNLIYCIPVWGANPWPCEDSEYGHFIDEVGQDHLHYSINHGCWFHKKDLLGKNRSIGRMNAAVDIIKKIRELIHAR